MARTKASERSEEGTICAKCLVNTATQRTNQCHQCNAWDRYWDRVKERWDDYVARVGKAHQRIESAGGKVPKVLRRKLRLLGRKRRKGARRA